MRRNLRTFAHFAFAVKLAALAASVLLLLSLLRASPGSAQTTVTAVLSGTVVDAAGSVVANANVVLSGPQRFEARSDARGRFTVGNIPYGTYRIDVTAPQLGHATREEIVVAGDTSVSVQYESTRDTSGLAVIGRVSTSAAAHINVSPTAVTTLTPNDFAEQGQSTWRNVLNEIPGVAIGNSTQTYPAIGSPINPQVISLGGALPYETAVLIDGMPITNISSGNGVGEGVDLGQYDPLAFRSFDISVGPGAQSPTIVDSIGGSINLHPGGYVGKNSFNASIGNNVYGGVLAHGDWAFRLNHLSITGSYGIDDSPGPSLGAGGYNAYLTPVSINGQSFTCTDAVGNCGQIIGPNNVTTTNIITCCLTSSDAWSKHSGSLSLRYDLSPAIDAEVFYTGQEFKAPVGGNGQVFDFEPPAGYAGAFPTGQSALYETYGTFSNYSISSNVLEGKVEATVGPGRLHFAVMRNTTIMNYANALPGTPMQQAVYGGGDLNGVPTVFNGETASVGFNGSDGYGHWYANNRDYTFGYDATFGASGHAGISFVHSFYDEPYDYGDSVQDYSGTIWNDNNYSNTDEWRVYAGTNPIRNVTTDLAWYFATNRVHVENPDDPTGNTYIGKSYGYSGPRFGAVWRPTSSISVRASAGGGFSQPQFWHLVGSNGAPTPNDPSSPTYYVQSLQNLGLQPETSFGLSLGTDIRLRPTTIASLDLYRTNVWGQFFSTQSVSGAYNGLPLYTSQEGNLGQSRYEGILLSLKHDVPQGVVWNVSGGFTRAYVVSLPGGFYDGPNGPDTENLTIVPTINFNGANTGSPIPYSQAFARIGYRWKSGGDALLDATYYGPNNVYYQPAFGVMNFNADLPLAKNLTLHASLQNITQAYDESYFTVGPNTTVSYPAIMGPPVLSYAYREPYGPRTFLVSLRLHL